MSLSLFRRLRNAFAHAPEAPPPVSRRGFIAGLGGVALGASLLTPDEAWADAEERAARFGIVPGTRVDAQGRPMKSTAFGIEPFIGEISMFAGNYEPHGWAFCNGQLLSIAQNTALFSILGVTYGGDGRTTFALPDLRGRFPMHAGQGLGLSSRILGHRGGTETVTLTQNQIPAHAHTLEEVQVRGTGTQAVGLTTGGTRGTASSSPAGGSQPHDNMPPFLTINFIIALYGVFPSRN